MNERVKFGEARHFLSRMATEQEDRQAYRHDLSAFLAAGRSVLQYALKEARTKQGGQRWYEGWMFNGQTLTFLKEKRDRDIHEEPVTPAAHFTRNVGCSVSVSAAISMVVRDSQGNIKQTVPSVPAPPSVPPPTSAVPDGVKYVFRDWTGPEDVLALCELHLRELEQVIEDGTQRGFISG